MDTSALVEVDSLEVIVIIDNELDIMSWVKQDTLQVGGTWPDVGVSQPATLESRGEAKKEPHMEDICCGAHGLSLMLVSSFHVFYGVSLTLVCRQRRKEM